MPVSNVGHTEPRNPFGWTKTVLEYNQVFWDAFEGGATIDTTNRWTTSSGGAGGATQVTGTLTVASGLTVAGFGLLQSTATFLPRNPAFMIAQAQVQLETGAPLTNAYRFFGFGSFPATPTLANPVNNGVGWDITTDGRLRAVTFASTVRTVIADLGIGGSGSGVQITDGLTHMYVIYFRGDRIVWCLDNYDHVVAQIFSGAQGPDINTLGWGALSLATSGIATTAQINLAQITLSESAHNSVQISDGTFPWRRATVTGTGQLIQGVTTYSPLLYQQYTSLSAATPLSSIPAGATTAEFIVEAQGVRYRDDGVAPTATVGMPVAAGVSFQYSGTLSTLQFIEQTASAKLNVSYYK